MLLRLACAAALSFAVPATSAPAGDTYSTYQAKRNYSPTRKFFVVVSSKGRATLYRAGRRLTRIWRSTLPHLPAFAFVADDGARTVFLERYYGNLSDPALPAVMIYDAQGRQVATYTLGELANLDRVFTTVSDSQWLDYSGIVFDGAELAITTVVTVRDVEECFRTTPAGEAWEKCSETALYERIRFDLTTGRVAERRHLQSP
jgi:hypothetical protein